MAYQLMYSVPFSFEKVTRALREDHLKDLELEENFQDLLDHQGIEYHSHLKKLLMALSSIETPSDDVLAA